jgi:hypothetical protein
MPRKVHNKKEKLTQWQIVELDVSFVLSREDICWDVDDNDDYIKATITTIRSLLRRVSELQAP